MTTNRISILNEIFYRLHATMADSLFNNSLYIMVSTVLQSGFGFIFWILAAKFYTVSDVGNASAILASINVLILFSRVGMDFSMIRFFQIYSKKELLGTALIVTSIVTLLLGIIFIYNVNLFSPDIKHLREKSYLPFYILCLLTASVVNLSSISFIANRTSKLQVFQSFTIGTRILFLLAFVPFGDLGIIISITLSFFITAASSLIVLHKNRIQPKITLNSLFLRDSFYYSTQNYISSLLSSTPNFILPIVVLNYLGSEKTAYYSIVYSIAYFIFMIPYSVNMALFVEGSHGESLKKTFLKSCVLVGALLIPSILIIFIYGDLILNVFGSNYAENGTNLLRIMILSSIPMAITSGYIALRRIEKKMNEIIVLNIISCFLIIILSMIFINRYGTIGVGYAWLLSYIIESVFIFFIYFARIKKIGSELYEKKPSN